MSMLHADLNGVRTVEDAVRYWCERHDEVRAEAEQEAQHWTRNLPPNVTVDRGALLRKLPLDDQRRVEADRLTPWLRGQGLVDDEGEVTPEEWGAGEEAGEEAAEAAGPAGASAREGTAPS